VLGPFPTNSKVGDGRTGDRQIPIGLSQTVDTHGHREPQPAPPNIWATGSPRDSSYPDRCARQFSQTRAGRWVDTSGALVRQSNTGHCCHNLVWREIGFAFSGQPWLRRRSPADNSSAKLGALHSGGSESLPTKTSPRTSKASPQYGPSVKAGVTVPISTWQPRLNRHDYKPGDLHPAIRQRTRARGAGMCSGRIGPTSQAGLKKLRSHEKLRQRDSTSTRKLSERPRKIEHHQMDHYFPCAASDPPPSSNAALPSSGSNRPHQPALASANNRRDGVGRPTPTAGLPRRSRENGPKPKPLPRGLAPWRPTIAMCQSLRNRGHLFFNRGQFGDSPRPARTLQVLRVSTGSCPWS